MRKQLDRQTFVNQFWDDVERLLEDEFGHSQPAAHQGIETYQQEVGRRELVEVVYNQGEAQTAKVIDGLIRNGVPVPSPE